MSREAMQQALEALEKVIEAFGPGLTLQQRAITALRQALETEKQEPVAWISESENLLSWDKFYDHMKPLYTAPPKREWVGLTDEEVSYCRYAATFCDELDTAYMAELIEQALKEKNQ